MGTLVMTGVAMGTARRIGDGVYGVRSDRDPRKTYTVTFPSEGDPTCTCPDFEYRGARLGPCKHINRVENLRYSTADDSVKVTAPSDEEKARRFEEAHDAVRTALFALAQKERVFATARVAFETANRERNEADAAYKAAVQAEIDARRAYLGIDA